MKTTICCKCAVLAAAVCLAVLPAFAECAIDRSAMSEAYWKIWNDAEQARIDALINGEWKTKGTVPAKGGKVSFHGFRGRYRLTWKDVDGKPASMTVEVK